MKRFLILAGLLFLLVSNAKADNVGSYFTMGVNDTMYLNPDCLGSSKLYPVRAHFESRFDSWTILLTMPDGLACVGGQRDHPLTHVTGMNVPYLTSEGINSIHEAVLTQNDTAVAFSSTISELGYWDPDSDGIYESYGTIKWEPGDYDLMFMIKLEFDYGYREGTVYLMNDMSGSDDLRGGTNDTITFTSVFIKVGYRLGDANGDGYIGSDDVSLIIQFINGRRTPDEFQFEASDVTEDGVLDVDDVALLIRWVLGMSSTQDIDIEDYI